MPRTTDPVSLIPSADVIRTSLAEARRRVTTLEFLLGVAEGVEATLTRDDAVSEPYRVGRQLAVVAGRKGRDIDIAAIATDEVIP